MANAKHIRMIEQEFAKACEKHPKFCDEFSHEDAAWDLTEINLKKENSKRPNFADSILFEEIAEAINAHYQGDREHCLQELAQCGAVILRMMQYVEEERWAHGDTCKKEGENINKETQQPPERAKEK